MCLEIFGLSLPAPAQPQNATAMSIPMPKLPVMDGLRIR
jgi:hypothetical protein